MKTREGKGTDQTHNQLAAVAESDLQGEGCSPTVGTATRGKGVRSSQPGWQTEPIGRVLALYI